MDSQGSQDSQDSTLTITDENRSEILYFAYGSNLSTEQMRQRCPYSTAVGLGKVTGWRWIINARGYANIGKSRMEEDTEESQVYGMLYLLPVEDEERLDRYEGVPWAYEKLHIEAYWVSNRDRVDGEEQRVEEELTPVKVLAYVDRQRVTEGRPKEEYVERMERGIEDAVENWGMSEEYADRVMRRFWVDG
ncbi:gamma-glutamyl cyclotransferase, AIG2-like domain-containing protein [Trichoderma breve]|uniref:gamma-glutamylcyclotransferase n=1 Tax=Trichoderma breve TaxID=2034170 RepID=A0A9W9B9E9_9HYPO|nr:gamma-glutamyl cyclotransferase, AIG2-like domain-containing protein [Trichoderma breve]KAJ4858392.1 gamma-glutamyl cyclotransferase, AIG2-like domain-containing protein [Trichoderma breve]